ncbi:MAG: UdgX family uracil-DNA binding protein [Akkermansiaceae bacterium]
MRSVDPGNDFASWRKVAKGLLAADVNPAEVIFEKEQGLFSSDSSLQEDQVEFRAKPTDKVPPEFIDLAKSVSCHANENRWALLYRILWRIVKNSERSLCQISSDLDIVKAAMMRKNVSREIHKMHAFVRFRLVDTDAESGRERYAAWFEPDHWIVEAATPFFQKRFANMDWSIFTPKGCAHWHGKSLVYTEGVSSDPIGSGDSMEDFWKTYYRSIFNPARVKVKMMQTEMPKKYWKNLPEAELIHQLIHESKTRVNSMREEELRPAKPAPKNRYLGSLREMSAASACSGPTQGQDISEMAKASTNCQACPLWKNATGTVFGEGPADAEIMIVGEQPGDREDIAGRVFVGPAGKLLDEALTQAGIIRSEIYLTNAVKHFKWTAQDTPRGKIRLHQSATRDEINACRPWVLAELKQITPEVLILMGSTAARSLLGRDVKVLRERGLVNAPHLAKRVILTVHPSYLLRIQDPKKRAAETSKFVEDLQLRDSNEQAND